MSDVDNLIEHHPKFLEPLGGRPVGDEGPLLRSCVVLIYAAWEVYFEDSLIEAALNLSKRTRADIPQATLDYLAKDVANDPWRLADDGWREALVETVTKAMRGADDDVRFGVNTAGPGSVSLLQKQILGVSILDRCRWTARGRSKPKDVKDKLSALVRLRGEIAHSGRPKGKLYLQHVREWQTFTRRLAEKHDEELERWLFGNQNALIRGI